MMPRLPSKFPQSSLPYFRLHGCDLTSSAQLTLKITTTSLSIRSLFRTDQSLVMTHKLPPNLLQLFAPRPALRYLPPGDHAPEERKTASVSRVAQFLPALEEYREIPYLPTESWFEKKIRVNAEKRERQEEIVNDERPKEEDPQVRGDAFKTLFVSRLSYDATEKDLEREFSRFGAIERVRLQKVHCRIYWDPVVNLIMQIRIVTNTHEAIGDDGKLKKKKKKAHCGYAFIVYERERDMKGMYSPLTRVYDRLCYSSKNP